MKKITFLAVLLTAFAVNAQIFEDNFEAETLDATTFANWDSVDLDGDGQFWEVADISGEVIAASPLDGFVADSDSWEGTPFMPDNLLVSLNPVDLTNVTDGILTFVMGTYQNAGTFIGDRLQVIISPSNDPAAILTETAVFDETIADVTPADNGGENSGVEIEIDLAAFSGQSVFVVFRHFDSFDENSVLLDEVVVNSASLSVADVQNVTFSHYYLAGSNELKLTANRVMDNVEVFSILGQEVMNRTLGSTDETISTSSLSTGVYLVRVNIEGTSQTFKIVKN